MIRRLLAAALVVCTALLSPGVDASGISGRGVGAAATHVAPSRVLPLARPTGGGLAAYLGPALGTYASNDIGSVAAFYSWLGATPAGAFGDSHVGRGDSDPTNDFAGALSDWTGSVGYVIEANGWYGTGHTMHLAVPMFPLHGGNFTDALAGNYDAAITSIATSIKNHLDASQSNFPIRFGWEFNHTFQPWSIGAAGQPVGTVDATLAANHAAWWRRARALFLAVSPKFRFIWCTNLGSYDYRAAWPGDDQVDIIGIDAYPGITQATYAAPNAVSAAAQASLWASVRDQAFGLADVASFATAKSKPLSIPEFGIQFDNGQVFMDLFYAWCVANKVAFVGWWDANAGGVSSKISDGSLPNTGAVVRHLWNAAQYVSEPQTPAYVATNRYVAPSDYTNSAWTKGAVAVSSPGGTSPSGAPVTLIVPDTTSNVHRIVQTVGSVQGQAVDTSFEVKAAGDRYVYLNGAVGPDTGQPCYDLQTGTVVQGQDGNAYITSLGNGWYKIGYRGTAPQGYAYPFLQINHQVGTDDYFSGDGTSGILVGVASFST